MSKSSVGARPTRCAEVFTSTPIVLKVAPGEIVLIESGWRVLQVSVRDNGELDLWDPACTVEYRAVADERGARA